MLYSNKILTSFSKFVNEVSPAVIEAAIFSRKICKLNLQAAQYLRRKVAKDAFRRSRRQVTVEITAGRTSFSNLKNYFKILFSEWPI